MQASDIRSSALFWRKALEQGAGRSQRRVLGDAVAENVRDNRRRAKGLEE